MLRLTIPSEVQCASDALVQSCSHFHIILKLDNFVDSKPFSTSSKTSDVYPYISSIVGEILKIKNEGFLRS
jgi:hypothetical protein